MPRPRKGFDPFTDEKTLQELNRDLAEVKELIGLLKTLYDRLYQKVEGHDAWRPAMKFKNKMVFYMLSRFQNSLERLVNRLDAAREEIEHELIKRRNKPDVIRF
jgi:uncharacterized coiled-coil protein SlyX